MIFNFITCLLVRFFLWKQKKCLFSYWSRQWYIRYRKKFLTISKIWRKQYCKSRNRCYQILAKGGMKASKNRFKFLLPSDSLHYAQLNWIHALESASTCLASLYYSSAAFVSHPCFAHVATLFILQSVFTMNPITFKIAWNGRAIFFTSYSLTHTYTF